MAGGLQREKRVIPERPFAGPLRLDDRWEVAVVEFNDEPKGGVTAVRETVKLWPGLGRQWRAVEARAIGSFAMTMRNRASGGT